MKIEGINKNQDIGNKIAMHIAASSPLAIDKDGINQEIVDKELEIIKAEILNSGKPTDLADKISKGKISKFLNDNSLESVVDNGSKKKFDIIKEHKSEKDIKIVNFVRFKVGEGI